MPDELMDDATAPGEEYVKPSSDDILREDPSLEQRSSQESEDGGIFSFGDTLAAIPRGVAGAAKDTYGLLDTVSGDILPDWDTNPFGESDSTVGSLVEGVTNFAAGFVPVAGWLGRAGKLGRVIDLTSDAEGAARTLEKLSGGVKLFGKANRIAVARGLAAGAIADFAVWDGHEERLSNFIEQFPALANPITEYLAASPDDGEIEGRFKGAIEGLALGGATELLFLGVKSLRAGRKVIEEGGTKEAAESASRAAVSEPELKKALRSVAGDPEEVADSPAVSANLEQPVRSAEDGAEEAVASAKSSDSAFSPEAYERARGDAEGNSRTTLVHMPIKTFLELAADGLDEEKLALTSSLLQAGTKYNSIPNLSFGRATESSVRVLGHEGRHRAKALLAAGYETMPVTLRSQDIRWSSAIDPKSPDFLAEWPTKIVSEGGDKTFPFPLAREKRAAEAASRAAVRENLELPLAENLELPLAEKLKRIRNEGTDRVIEVKGAYSRPNIPAKISKGLDELAEGKITADEFAEKMARAEQAIDEKGMERELRRPYDRTRGVEMARERLAKAQRTGAVTEEGYNFVSWLLRKNPDIAQGVTIRLSGKAAGGTSGTYAPLAKMITLFKGAATDATAVHEFLHHSERMMPQEIQEGLKQAWRRDLGDAWKSAVDAGDEKTATALQKMLMVGWGVKGDQEIAKLLPELFGPGGLDSKEFYQFFGPSEYWAVRGTELLSKRYAAETWIEKARVWMRQLLYEARDFFGMKSDAALYRAIDEVLSANGTFRSPMLMKTNLLRDMTDGRSPLLREIGFDDDDIADILKEARGERPAKFDETLGGPSGSVNPREMDSSERLALALNNKSMSWKFWDTPEDAGHVLGIIDRLFRTKFGGDIPSEPLNEQYNKAITKINELVGSNNEQSIMAMLGRDLDNAVDIRRRAIGYAFALESHTRHLVKIADDIIAGAGETSVEAATKLRKAAEFNAELQFGVKALRNEQGRALGSNRIRIGNYDMPEWMSKESMDPRVKQAELDKTGGLEGVVDLAMRVKAAAGDGFSMKGVAQVARASKGNPTFNMLIEYWMNALLGGPKTLVVNVLGPTLNSIYTPLESLVGAGIISAGSKLRGHPGVVLEQQKVMKDLVGSLTELMQGGREALGAVKKMGLSGEGLLNGRAGVVDPGLSRDAITSAKAGVDPGSAAGKAIDWIGPAIRLPTRLLASSDEFVRQVNYRARALSYFSNEALEKGLRGEGAAQHVMDRMDTMVWEHQAYSAKTVWGKAVRQATSEGAADVSQRARELAREMWDPKLNELSKKFVGYSDEIAFTTPAPAGSLSNTIQRAVAQHPYLRLVLPFINTPLNIIRFTGDRVNPLNPVRALLATQFPAYAKSLESGKSRLLADFVSKDAERQASAAGRMVMGMSVVSFVLAKAHDGTITGRGPSDPEQRKTLMEAGWQPYSIRVGNGYMSYARLDPLATIIGSAADVMDYSKFAATEDTPILEQLASGLGVSLANNFTNKSYLTGLANFIEVLEAPDRKLPRYLQRMAGSFVPNYLGQSVLPAGDDNMRDIRSIIDSVSNRIPGLSSTLPPERNALGEPVKRVRAAGTDSVARWVDLFQPIVYREVSDDLIKTEMANLRHGFTPPKRTVSGIDLSEVTLPNGQNAYDRWGELTGTVAIGGMRLKDALRREILSADYKKLTDVSSDGFESPRVARINTLLRKYRDAAYKQLLRGSPVLSENERGFKRTKKALNSGLDPRLLPPNPN